MNKKEFRKHINAAGDWNQEIIDVFLKDIEEDSVIIKTDSRKIKKGDVFLAIEGEKSDAHEFVNEAFKMGASFCIVSKFGNYDGSCLFVDDTVEFVQKISSSYFLEYKPETLAISGSNGKTTTKEWIKTILKTVLKDKRKLFVNSGNMNTEIGLPVSIINGFFPAHDLAVLEMGMSEIGDLKLLCSLFKPDYGMLTNIGSAHIGNFGDADGILSGKRELTDSIGKNGIIILNGSDSKLQVLSEDYRCKILKYGFEEKQMENNDFSVNRYSYYCDDKGFKTDIEITAVGKHIPVTLNFFAHKGQVSNLAGAIAAASVFTGIEEISLFDFGEIEPLNERFKFEYIYNNWLVSDFYNSSVESCEAALDLLNNIREKGIISSFSFVVGSIAETGEYKESIYNRLCELIKKYEPDELFVYSKNSDIMEIKKRFADVNEFSDKYELAKKIRSHLLERKGQAFLFKASRSVEMEDVYEIVVDFPD